MNLNDIRYSISALPSDESIKLVRRLRESRRTVKRARYVSKKKAAPKPINLKAIVKGLSPDMAKHILEQLNKGK